MRNKNVFLKIVLLSVVLIVVAIIVFALFKFSVFGKFMGKSEEYIGYCGKFASLIYILIFSLRTLFVFFPYSLMVTLGGGIFGYFEGFIYSMLAVFISATFAFYISRFFGMNTVNKLLRGKIKRFDLNIEEHGFKIILFMRVSLIFPFDILNFAAGLTKVRYRDFILGTLLGILPETFSLSYLGANLKNPYSMNFIISIIMVILLVIIPLAVKKFKKRK